MKNKRNILISILLAALLTVTTRSVFAASTGSWSHLNGSDTRDQAGVYSGGGEVPGGRQDSTSWIDASGNLWLFGGYGNDKNGGRGELNDLWKYTPATDTWVHVSGSDVVDQFGVYSGGGEVPGARKLSTGWTDASGNLWLFGGAGRDKNGTLSRLNDLWKYTPNTDIWSHESGSDIVNQAGVYSGGGETPGARYYSISWIDTSGNLLLFGGFGYDKNGDTGYINDLWKYTPSTNIWVHVSGSDTKEASGVYSGGSEVLGARGASASWIDVSGNLWLFGGFGYDKNGTYGELNDLWKYTPNTDTWSHESGSDIARQAGVYSGGGAIPGTRGGSVSWLDAKGNLWLFSGFGYDKNEGYGNLNDLWKYTPTTDTWTHESGSDLINQVGVYSGGGEVPGARIDSASWVDGSGNLWLFGGNGKDKNGDTGNLNDLWKFTLPTLPPATPTGVKASDGITSKHIKVSWNSVTDTNTYEVYRYNGTSWVKRATTTDLFYKDTNTTPLVTYKYKVKACNANGCSALSSMATGYRAKLVFTQLVRNLSFEADTNNDGIPNAWARYSNNGLDKRICSTAVKYAGNCGYRFLGDGVAAKDWIRQNLSVKALAAGGGHDGDKLVLSFWARSIGLELADNAYVLVKVRNSTTNQQQVIRVNLTGTYAYKRLSKTLTVTIGDYDQVWVYVYANGTATENLYIDNVSVKLRDFQTK